MTAPFAVQGPPFAEAASSPELQEVIEMFRERNPRFYCGDPLLDLWAHDGDITIHGALDISAHGWEALSRGVAGAAARFSGGDVRFTPLGGRVVGDMAYVAGFEEGSAVLDGERRAIRLRATMVFQRIGGRWRAVHRHGEMAR